MSTAVSSREQVLDDGSCTQAVAVAWCTKFPAKLLVYSVSIKSPNHTRPPNTRSLPPTADMLAPLQGLQAPCMLSCLRRRLLHLKVPTRHLLREATLSQTHCGVVAKCGAPAKHSTYVRVMSQATRAVRWLGRPAEKFQATERSYSLKRCALRLSLHKSLYAWGSRLAPPKT